MKGLKFYNEYFSDYQFAEVLQTLMLIFFIMFFTAMLITVWKRPKDFYKDIEKLPLEKDDNTNTFNT